jgi:DNA repair exonuclease SbcCD ATPase subunit
MDDERLAAASMQVKEVQAELALAVQRCHAAEAIVQQTSGRVRDLEHAFEDKSEDLLNTQQQLAEAQVRWQQAQANISAVEAKLHETRKSAAVVEAQLRDADARRLGLEDDLMRERERAAQLNAPKINTPCPPAEVDDAARNKMLSELKRNTVELEKWVATAESAQSQAADLRVAVCRLEDQVALFQEEAGSTGGTSAKTAALKESLLDLNAKLTCLGKENAKLRCQLDEELARGAQSCQAVPEVHASACTARPATGDVGMQTEVGKTMRDIALPTCAEMPSADPIAVDSSQHVDAELASKLEKTRSALKKLEAENKQLKGALDSLNSNLKTVVSTCHDSSVAKHVAEIIDKLELKRELKGSGVCAVWDRLYCDAMTRVDRMERSRKDCLSPLRSLSSSKGASLEELEQESPAKSQSPQRCQRYSHIDSDVHDSLRTSSQDSTLASNLHCTTLGSTATSWCLPPCSPTRQVRCASASRLRASRQSSRGGRAVRLCVPEDHSGSIAHCGTLSPVSPPCRSLKSSVSLPFLHGHRLPSWQGAVAH